MRKILSVFMALLLACGIPLSALAIEVDVTYGDVTIGDNQVTHTDSTNTTKTEDHEGSVTVKGTTTENTITVNTNTEVHVTLDNVAVNNAHSTDSSRDGAGMTVTTGENGKVTVELEGTNVLEGTGDHAGLETNNNQGSLEITDTDNDGSLTAEGGNMAAGIGGSAYEDGTNITISGGTIEATGSDGAAGIGGGFNGAGENITITGGDVTATGGRGGAGIGGGGVDTGMDYMDYGGTPETTASGVVISGGNVTATGGLNAAGIGGGHYGNVADVTISGGDVTATGGYCGAGIGGGLEGTSENITIEGDAQVDAKGSNYAADVGDGENLNSTEKKADNVTLNLGPNGRYNTQGNLNPDEDSNDGVEDESAAVAQEEYGNVFRYNRGRLLNEYGVNVNSLFAFGNDWEETEENGTVTIKAAEDDEIVVTVKSLKVMMGVGIETVIFNGTKLVLKDAVADRAAGDLYTITATAVLLNGNPV